MAPGIIVNPGSASPLDQLVEQLKANPGSTLVLDNDCFSVRAPGYYDLPEEDPDAKEGDPRHWLTIEKQAEKFDLPKIEAMGMPHELLDSLAKWLGFKTEPV